MSADDITEESVPADVEAATSEGHGLEDVTIADSDDPAPVVADVGETLVADTGPTPEAAPEPGGFAGVFGSPDA